jgi:hypothetical protein
MMVQSEVLKACPFCAASTELSRTMLPPGKWWYHAECDASDGGCGAQGPFHETGDGAIAAWNTRTPAVATDEGVVRDALLAEIERQTDGQWPVNTNDDDNPVWLVDDTIDFDELARAAISAMAHRQ